MKLRVTGVVLTTTTVVVVVPSTVVTVVVVTAPLAAVVVLVLLPAFGVVVVVVTVVVVVAFGFSVLNWPPMIIAPSDWSAIALTRELASGLKPVSIVPFVFSRAM